MPSSQFALMQATKKRAAKLEAKGKPMNEIGRAIFALAVTAIVCIAIYLIIRYLTVV